MAPVRDVQDDELIDLLENDPDSERLLGKVEAALTNLRELAGKNDGDSAVKIDRESA
jgi:hypothetical protein